MSRMKKILLATMLVATAATGAMAKPTPKYNDIYQIAIGHSKEKICYDNVSTPMTGHDKTFIASSVVLPGWGSILHPTFWKAMKSLDQCANALSKKQDYHVMHDKKHYNVKYVDYLKRVDYEYKSQLSQKGKQDPEYFK